MLIEELSKYGDIEHQYSGKGRFRNSSNACDFGVVQLSDGSIYLICKFESISDSVKLELNNKDDPTFIGVTEEGEQVTIEGELILIEKNESYPTSRSTFIASGEFYLRVGNKNFSEKVEFRFNLTNFVFIGTQVLDVGNKLNAIHLQLNEYQVLIQKIPNFDKVETQLNAQKNVDVTCQAIFKNRTLSDIENIVQMATNICSLLTIANATVISWISFEIHTSGNKKIYTEHRLNITTGYSSFPLIDKIPVKTIENFVNNVYLHYCILNPVYDLASVGRIYGSVRMSGYIEIRSLSIASLVEYLLNKFAEAQPSKQTLIDEKLFKEKKEELKKGVSEVYERLFPGLDKEIYNLIKQKMSDFNRLTFQERLHQFIEFFCIPISQLEIQEFIRSRNKLAHGLSFKTDNSVQEYEAMVHFFDRLLLGMLNYRGYYINFSKTPHIQGEEIDYFEPTC